MPGAGKAGTRSVEEYLANLPADPRAALRDLRETIRKAAPRAEEVISYRMPAFRQGGILVYYAAFSEHCSLFIGSVATQRKFAAELKPFLAGKGTVHFTPERPLPAALVTRIVKARVAENETRAAARRRAPARAARKARGTRPRRRSPRGTGRANV